LEAKRKVSIEADPASSGPGASGQGARAGTATGRSPATGAGQANGDTTLRAVDLTLSFGPRAALGVPAGDLACVIRLLWTADGEPAAVATTYLARHLAGEPPARDDDSPAVPQAALAVLPLFAVPDPAGRAAPAADPGPGKGTSAAARPRGAPGAGPGEADEGGAEAAKPAAPCVPSALFVELQLPPAAVARSLRLSVGQPAAMVTVRFDDPAADRPAAVTVAVLRPDLFRIVIESPAAALPQVSAGSFSGAWTTATQDWEP